MSRLSEAVDRGRELFDEAKAGGIKLTVIRSKHGPTVKVGIETIYRKTRVWGETLPIHLELDKIDLGLVRQVLPDTKLHRETSPGAGSRLGVPMSLQMKIEKAVLAKLKAL